MFANNSLAKIWSVSKTTDKYADVELSTSYKNKKTNAYEKDFEGYVRLIGKALSLNAGVGDIIKLTSVGCSRKYDKVSQRTFTNFVVFDAEMYKKSTNSPAHASNSDPAPFNADNGEITSSGDEEQLPF